MEYRVDRVSKIWKNRTKTHILGIFRGHVPVQLEHVPVHVRFWSFLANLYRYMLDMYRYTPVLFSSFDQFSYFDHNLLISYPI